jgi:hypothetical protein
MHETKQPVCITVEAVVIRADGRVENLGVIAYRHRNPLRQFWWQLKQLVRGRRPGHITSQ